MQVSSNAQLRLRQFGMNVSFQDISIITSNLNEVEVIEGKRKEPFITYNDY